MSEEKKNNKLLIIILLVALFLIGIGTGLLLSNVFNSKEEKKENNQEEKIKTIHDLEDGEIDINNEEIKKYFDMYKPIYFDDNLMLNSLTTDLSKLQLASRLVNDQDYVEVPCSSIDSSTLEENTYCGGIYNKSNWKNSSNTTKSIKKEVMNKYYKYYFGSNKEISNDRFEVKQLDVVNMFIYDLNLNSYVEILFDGGGTGPKVIDTLEKAIKSGNDLILKLIERFDDPDLSNNSSVVILTLTWEEETNHYIFKNRHHE